MGIYAAGAECTVENVEHRDKRGRGNHPGRPGSSHVAYFFLFLPWNFLTCAGLL
jgi:hypothetical protein